MLSCYLMVNFTDWLTNQLKLKNMTPAELARASGKAPAVISRVLNGDRKPEPKTLIAIARALNSHPKPSSAPLACYHKSPPILSMSRKSFTFFTSYPRKNRKKFLNFYASKPSDRRLLNQKQRAGKSPRLKCY